MNSTGTIFTFSIFAIFRPSSWDAGPGIIINAYSRAENSIAQNYNYRSQNISQLLMNHMAIEKDNFIFGYSLQEAIAGAQAKRLNQSQGSLRFRMFFDQFSSPVQPDFSFFYHLLNYQVNHFFRCSSHNRNVSGVQRHMPPLYPLMS